MKENKRTQILLDATEGIREAYIEEAAVVRHTRPLWAKLAAAAAVLALVIGLLGLLWLDAPEGTPMSFLTIQAHAADGSIETLSAVGDTCKLQTGTSELFPGKEVYILDVLFMDEDGNSPDLSGCEFHCSHHGKHLQPGQSDEHMRISWVEEDGLSGYRIVGWCEKTEYIALWIYGDDDKILHQKELLIEATEDGYQMSVRISYNYQENRSTEELIDVVMRQDYSWHLMFSSNFDQRFLLGHTGFRELIERPDAPSKLLALFIRSQREKGIFSLDKIFVGMSADNDWLLNVLLTWDEIWEGLTPREQALALGHGCSRLMLDSDSMRFGKNVGYLLQITAPDTADENSVLEVSYNGITTRKEDDHIRFFPTIGTDEDGREVYGWAVFVCFKDKTEVTFTVRDKAGNVLQQEKYLVSRIESEYSGYYEIEKLTP